MKKTIIALAVVMFAGIAPSFAQGGGFQMPPPEERVKRVHFKADSAFKLDEAKMKEMDALIWIIIKRRIKFVRKQWQVLVAIVTLCVQLCRKR